MTNYADQNVRRGQSLRIVRMREIRDVPVQIFVEAFRESDVIVLELGFRKSMDADNSMDTLDGVCTLLASAFLGFILERDLLLPERQTLLPLWEIVRRSLEISADSSSTGIIPFLGEVGSELPPAWEAIFHQVQMNWAQTMWNGESNNDRDESVCRSIQIFAHASQALVLYLLEIKDNRLQF